MVISKGCKNMCKNNLVNSHVLSMGKNLKTTLYLILNKLLMYRSLSAAWLEILERENTINTSPETLKYQKSFLIFILNWEFWSTLAIADMQEHRTC